MPDQENLEALVQRWTEGDQTAFDQIVELVYGDLRAIAHSHLKQQRNEHTLNTTALVHEAYLAMSQRTGPEWQGRAQFFALVSKVMRHLLIDYARKKNALKRGAGEVHVPFQEEAIGTDIEAVKLLALDQALDRLGERDQRMAQIVECRYFGGMPHVEIAEAIGVSVRTVERDWSRARTYLFKMLSPGSPTEEASS